MFGCGCFGDGLACLCVCVSECDAVVSREIEIALVLLAMNELISRAISEQHILDYNIY